MDEGCRVTVLKIGVLQADQARPGPRVGSREKWEVKVEEMKKFGTYKYDVSSRIWSEFQIPFQLSDSSIEDVRMRGS